MSQTKTQPDLLSRNDTTSIPGDSQRLAHITTVRERLDLIQTMLPHSSDTELVPEIQNSMSLLSTTSSHWALKLLIYLASNNLLKPEDLDSIWRMVEETGIKELVNISKSLHLGEPSLKAALEYLFEAGVWASRTDIVSWLLDIDLDPNIMIRSQNMQGSHLPLVVALLGLRSARAPQANSMVRLLLSKGALTLLPCCEKHNTATHLAIMNGEVDINNLEMFLQAAKKPQRHHPSSQYLTSVSQENWTNRGDCEAQENRDTVSLTLHLLVDAFEKFLSGEWLPTLVSSEMLMEAVSSNNHKLIRIFHERGLSMDCCDIDERSPLIKGLEFVDKPVMISTVELLLGLGASPNYDPRLSGEGLCSPVLETAIHNYYHENLGEVIEILIKNGATIQGTVSCGNINHQNLMHCALRADAEAGHFLNNEVPILLHNAGLPFPKSCLVDCMESAAAARLQGFSTPYADFERLLLILIHETTDLSLSSKIGWTALDYALDLEMYEAGDMMFEKGAVHSYKFVHDYCLSGYCKFDELATLFGRVPHPQSDKQRRTLLFYRIIGTLRARDLSENELVAEYQVGHLLYDYCKMRRSKKHENYIIREACVTGNVCLIRLALEFFSSTYSPAAIEQLIWHQTKYGADYWTFIQELLRRRLIVSSHLEQIQEQRIFLRAVFDALGCSGNSELLKWFHENSKEAFERANLHPSAFLMNVFQICRANVSEILRSRGLGGLEDINMNILYQSGFKTSTYLGLLAVCTGRFDQMCELLHHGMRPNRRFSWSLTLLQTAVAQADLPMTRRLLEAGADVNGPPPWRDIPHYLHLRIEYQVFCQLTSYQALLHTKRRNALQLAVEQGNFSMVVLLLESGAGLNGPPARVGGATAIQIACIKGYIDIARLLIEKGADVNAVGAEYSGRTALEGAAEHGRLDTVFLLLESGCQIHGSSRGQYIRAVGFARAEAHHILAKELQDYGDWTNDDEYVLSSTDLRDVEPKSRDLEEDWHADEDVSEVDSADLKLEESEPFPFEMDGESEFGDCGAAGDDEDATSSDQRTPKGIVDEDGSSERSSEPQAARLDTWDDLLEYYGDDEGV